MKLTKYAFVIMTSLLVSQGGEAVLREGAGQQLYAARATLARTIEVPNGMSAEEIKGYLRERLIASPGIDQVRFVGMSPEATKAGLAAIAAYAPSVTVVRGALNQEGVAAFAKEASARELDKIALDREVFAKFSERDQRELLAKEMAIANGDKFFKAYKNADGKYAWKSLTLPAFNDAGIASSPTELSNAYQKFITSSVSEGN